MGYTNSNSTQEMQCLSAQAVATILISIQIFFKAERKGKGNQDRNHDIRLTWVHH